MGKSWAKKKTDLDFTSALLNVNGGIGTQYSTVCIRPRVFIEPPVPFLYLHTIYA